MKKFLLTATMLVAFTALSKAQQGRVGINTTTPATTLDVVASTDASRPDALLVPRLSRADLEAKATAYADGTASVTSAQNGALVFVNALGGAGTGKTVNVTATGFYYYDGTSGNNVWKPLSGGAPVKLPTFRTINAGPIAAILATDVTNCVILNSTNISSLTLPPPTPDMAGKTIKIFEATGGANVTITSTEYKSTGAGIIINATGISLITDGVSWYSDSLQ